MILSKNDMRWNSIGYFGTWKYMYYSIFSSYEHLWAHNENRLGIKKKLAFSVKSIFSRPRFLPKENNTIHFERRHSISCRHVRFSVFQLCISILRIHRRLHTSSFWFKGVSKDSNIYWFKDVQVFFHARCFSKKKLAFLFEANILSSRFCDCYLWLNTKGNWNIL